MKQIVYVFGVIGGMALVLGIFLKGIQWPGAGIILGFGTIVTLIFIPLFAIYHYRKDMN